MNNEVKPLPSKEKILNFFNYDHENGILIWKNHWNIRVKSRFVGKMAGTTTRCNHRQVMIEGSRFYVHRIIYFLETGEEPYEIDHINGDALDNRIANLKAVSRRKNQQNRKRHREGKLVGAHWNKSCKKWQSYIKIDGKKKHLGYFNTEEEAHGKYLEALANLV